MPYVIFFKKVNKRSFVNYENENFHKYLLDFKKKLTTDKNVRVSYRRKNNNIGKFMGMFHSIEAKMDALIKALNGNGNPVPNSPEDPVNSVSLKNPATAALLQTFTKALQNGGFLPKNPLYKRDVDNNNSAPTSDEPFSSISGPNLTLWKLHELKKKVKADDFVANLPNASAVAAMAGA